MTTAYAGHAIGRRTGNGFVHGATAKQARFITHLLATRIHDLPYTTGEEVNIRHASRVIDHLKACPAKNGDLSVKMASEKQVEFIKRLTAERDTSRHGVRFDDPENLTMLEARKIIDWLLTLPRQTAPGTTAELDAGIYFCDGIVVKVQKAVHGSGHMYAKALDPETGRFEYHTGLIRKLDASMKMTLEQATQYGALYGVCCNCGRTLTDENSIEAGIGPVCAKKFL